MKNELTYKETLDCRDKFTSSNWVWKVRDGLQTMLIEHDNILFIEWIMDRPRIMDFETFLTTDNKRTELTQVIRELDILYVLCMRQRKAYLKGKTQEYNIVNPILNLTEWIEIHNNWSQEYEDYEFSDN